MTFSVSDLWKSFGDNEVLKGVSFTSHEGQIHALLGANGAGKSTLIKCLSGAHVPDAGEIELDGRRFSRLTPDVAHERGIAVIYQNLSLIGSLSVSDNIFLGRELKTGPFVNQREQTSQAQAALDQLLGDDYGLAVRTMVEELSIAEQQLVEIAKALSRPNIRLLILDEPTASLSEREVSRLKSVLRLIAKRGVHVLFITHILSDVFDICEQITVLRDGRVVLDAEATQVSISNLAEAITGERQQFAQSTRAAAADREQVVLSVEKLSGDRFSEIDLKAHRGEVVGIFGLVGSGRSELLETIFGARRSSGGRISINGRELDGGSGTAGALARGVALVPGDRRRQAVFGDLDALENMLQPAFGQLAFNPLRRDRERELKVFKNTASQISLRPNDPSLPGSSFSGGNLQKIVIARWAFVYEGVEALLLDEPTQGIDVGARADIYRLLRSSDVLSSRTIVFTTSDPDEAEFLADRVLVLCRGRIIGELDAHQLDRERMLSLAHADFDGRAFQANSGGMQ